MLLWAAGRIGVLLSAELGPVAAAILDLLFPAVFLAVVAREILTGRNWRNLPMVGALAGLLLANALVHAAAFGFTDTAEFGNRFGIAILLLMISLIGGRIIPSFTRNWLTKRRPDIASPVPANWFDTCVLGATALALAAWLFVPDSTAAALACLAAGFAHGLRLARWRGLATLREPLLWVLHLGYAWLAVGFCLLGVQAVAPWLPPFTALHALTVGAIGTMTLAVMTRATLGHTGQQLPVQLRHDGDLCPGDGRRALSPCSRHLLRRNTCRHCGWPGWRGAPHSGCLSCFTSRRWHCRADRAKPRHDRFASRASPHRTIPDRAAPLYRMAILQ